MQLWGASGGGADPGTGGDGGFISGNINISAGQIVYFLVGQKGQTGDQDTSGDRKGNSCPDFTNCAAWAQNTRSFGFGGLANTNNENCYSSTGAGGSFAYLNNNINSKSNLLIVAGGGGGASDSTYASGTNYSYGGYYAGHGNNNGGAGINKDGSSGCANGGTQSAGGATTCTTATAGSYLYGGNGGTAKNANAGGGGGYYGGGGGDEETSSGGGGSSYINTAYGAQNASETATVMAGGDKNRDGLDGKIVITYLGT